MSDFGASARRADGKPDGGDVLELRVRVNAAQYGLSKSETMREVAKEFLSEADTIVLATLHICSEKIAGRRRSLASLVADSSVWITFYDGKQDGL